MKNHTLITGASNGIGLEFTKIASREKRNLLLVARSESKLKAVVMDLKKQGVVAHYLALDLSKPSAPQKIFDFCKQNNIFINELINNAGFGDYGSFADSDLKTQMAMIDLNIRSLTELTHLFLPAMVAKKDGRVLNLGSVASFLPGPRMSVYFASKNYVLSFSRALSEELSGSGVTVTCLCPGATSTGFSKAASVSDTHSTANSKTTAHEVAQYGWYQMQRGVPIAIHGRGNQLSVWFAKFVPRNLLPKLVKLLQK